MKKKRKRLILINIKLIVTIIIFLFGGKILQASPLKLGFRDIKSSLYALVRINGFNDKDTAVFNLTNSNGVKVFNFSNDNILNISSYGIKLIVKEESQDSYTLLVKIKNKLILSKKHIKGISKVYLDKNYLMFSIFTYVDEDGNNEGYGYFINLKNNLVKTFSKQLKNTCNPMIINKDVYFIDGLSLIMTDLDFKIKSDLKIVYSCKGKKNDFAYIDTYLICRLSKQDNTKLIIDFSPGKSLGKCKSYSGSLNVSSKVILLK